MKCPICGTEMEQGRLHIIQKGGSNILGHSVAFYDEEDCKKSFLQNPFLSPRFQHSFSNFDSRKDMPRAYYCPICRKIVSLLDIDTDDNSFTM